jgi:uncharacterized phage protein (TIGR02218 family)
MPRVFNAALLPYLYRKTTKVYNAYKFSIDATDDYKYIVNNQNRFGYTALAAKRTPIRLEEGTVLNELEIGLDNVDLAFKQLVMAGKFDNKKCVVQLLFEATNGTLAGSIDIFVGYIDAPKGDENWLTVTIRPFPVLERQFPKRIYQTGCNWTFCDSYCGLNLTDYQVNTTLAAESDGVTFTCVHNQDYNYFMPGYIEITSGEYIGEYRPIRSNDATTVTARISFRHTVAAGTSVRLQKLCYKNPSVCMNEFDNYTRFGGFPHVPKKPIL